MQKYEYQFVKAYTMGVMREETFQDEIKTMAKKGWRFISWIPRGQSSGGVKTMMLVFERPIKQVRNRRMK